MSSHARKGTSALHTSPALDAARTPAREIPTLITLDVHDHERLEHVLNGSAEFFDSTDQRATYFVPSGLVNKSPGLAGLLRGLRKAGHSVGCHGLNHTPDEDLRRLSREAELALLTEATRAMEDALGEAVTSFRAPVFRLSNNTLPILAGLGYRADLSVTPQRLSLLSSTPGCFQWLWAPRAPYRPHERSPYRRGRLDLFEIPTSCFVLPFAHGTLMGLRSRGMNAMLKLLVREASHFERVLVPLLHPESITGDDIYWPGRKLRWSDLIPRRYGGLSLRYHFGDVPPDESQRLSQGLLAGLRERPALRAMSVDEYLDSTFFRRAAQAAASR